MASIDYSLYLVTGRDLLPPGKDYLESLEESLQGGVTVVQIREKNIETSEFLEIAQNSLALCNRYNVPLLVNDRIDIALAIGARGIHIGQTDMPVAIARRLLPPGSIIGISCTTREQVRAAREDGLDYVGLGSAFGTQTKKLTSDVVGPRGLAEFLGELEGSDVQAVAIGGIKRTNALRLLHGAVSTTGRPLDGIAVVSDIVGSTEPKAVSRELATIVSSFKKRAVHPFHGLSYNQKYTPESVKSGVAKLLERLRTLNPLVHQITNHVVTTQSANVTLAIGASPVMATAPEEMEDLSKAYGSLLVNFGTISDKAGMFAAGQWANRKKRPAVFDPVGVGASQYRQTSASDLMNAWQASVIKGNAGEIATLAKSTEVRGRGVDSVGKGFSDPAAVVRNLARRERCTILLTGREDWISDGTTVVRLSNGDSLLGNITGSGCIVGSITAAFCAAANSIGLEQAGAAEEEAGSLVLGDMFLGAIGGVLAITVASEIAAARPDVYGPGTFLPALIDELSKLTPQVLAERAKVEVLAQ